MRGFLRTRVAAAGGDPLQVDVLMAGGSRTIGGVKVASVATVHNNNLDTPFLSANAFTDGLAADGLSAYVGPAQGYVLKFSNGLVVYLSGDTGHTSDMKTIVRGFYRAKLAVMNMGDIFSMGPTEAAWAVNKLIKPRSVIPSHSNENGTPGTKTRIFTVQVRPNIGVHVPLSGITMEFNRRGVCVSGC